MKVYNVYPDDYDYDQYKGVVIVAENEAQVLEMLKDPPYGRSTYFEPLQEIQYRDQIKNQWCIDNNIPIIRIPYTHLSNITIKDLVLETSDFIYKGE